MIGNEITATDQHVRRLLLSLEVDSPIWEQGDGSPELKLGLRGGSKSATPSNPGKPEFMFLSDNHLVVIENKRDHARLSARDEEGELDLDYPARADYATNGAVHYAQHLQNTSEYFPSIFAVGVTGDEIHLEVECFHVSKHGTVEVPAPQDFLEFDKNHIDEYYRVAVLGDLPKEERDIRELRVVANKLHEDLRTFASVSSDEKAKVISALLLALKNPDFSIEHLRGEQIDQQTDGWKVWRAASDFLDRSYVDDNSGNMKRGTVKDQWTFIRDSDPLNRVQKKLGGITPLRKFAQTLEAEVLRHISVDNSFDVLGSFYGEFVRYGNSDGAELGIVLTPHHITSLMVDLIDVNRHDYVLDPCAGTASFLITAMQKMTAQAGNDEEALDKIKSERLHGIEMSGKLYSVGVTNMILRGDGKAHFHMGDMFHVDDKEIRTSLIKQPDGSTARVEHGFNKCLMNPPYSQARNEQTTTRSEWHFVHQALSMLDVGGQLAAIIPVSLLTNKSTNKTMKRVILENHTLERVITLNTQTFYPVGNNPAIVHLTANKPHPEQKRVQFINFTDDGMHLRPHIGLVNDGTHQSKRDHLFDVVNGNVDESTEYAVRSTVVHSDEWLHSYFYFREDPPKLCHFEKSIADFLSFQFMQVAHGRPDLFEDHNVKPYRVKGLPQLEEKAWRGFRLDELGLVPKRGKRLIVAEHKPGNAPYVSSTGENNGVANFVGNQTKVRRFTNCITVANSGSVGATFYHPYEFVASDHVTAIRGDHLNKHHYIFLMTCIQHGFQDKYSFNREISDTRIAREVVLLPTNEIGEPDWAFMEAFAADLEAQSLDRTFTFFGAERAHNSEAVASERR